MNQSSAAFVPSARLPNPERDAHARNAAEVAAMVPLTMVVVVVLAGLFHVERLIWVHPYAAVALGLAGYGGILKFAPYLATDTLFQQVGYWAADWASNARIRWANAWHGLEIPMDRGIWLGLGVRFISTDELARPFQVCAGSVIGAHCSISTDAQIAQRVSLGRGVNIGPRTVIWADVVVHGGVKIAHSTIEGGARVQRGASVTRSLVPTGKVVAAGTIVTDQYQAADLARLGRSSVKTTVQEAAASA